MKVAVNITKTHNPFGEDYWASCLRENLTSSSYGEGLETGREFAQEPRQSFTRHRHFQMKDIRMTEDMLDEKTENDIGKEEKPFSEKLLRHIMEPTHMGEMAQPSGHAIITGPCGDTDEFFVKIFSSRIQEIRFRTTGCFFTIAACDAVATLAEGRMVREAMRINQEAVLEYLGGLPEDHRHCALLAANTLHKALQAYVIRGTGL